ncbi:TetR/AcrR family transcriptional regulator [Croceicoccus sp. Ery15]|uniref:TetR/AcrR family transcriptional regulator n=1 Tax=Croceicoccus sp. Ery15 TaxID=1703338 RepID=UPI001E390EFB|nr:TetR/AcrR family transcriptional regulator [Croceicoccus sp. Ery15]
MESPQQERLDRRRQAFQQAARDLFIEQGYEQTTLAEVVERAGGSLATLYKLFGNKEGLLDAVLSQSRDLGHELVETVAANDLPPDQALHRIAAELSAIFLAPSNMAITRIVIARSVCNPEFARNFFDRSQMKALNRLRRLFTEWSTTYPQMTGDPVKLADLFTGLIAFDFQMQAISHGSMEPPTAEELRKRTEFFLRGAGLSA